MSKGIRLSKKHGLNPSILVCPICGKESGLALCGKMKGDAEAPRYMLDNKPCNDCKEKFEDGYVAIMEATMDANNKPQRTGRLAFIKRHCFKTGMISPNVNAVYCDKDMMDQIENEHNKLNEQSK